MRIFSQHRGIEFDIWECEMLIMNTSKKEKKYDRNRNGPGQSKKRTARNNF